ncbi:MAG: hypothetical protein HC924_14765 [Synechococcaceae cyanobacterium SM2_3_2]|nr:hypothetical protein [Synechococcaceae cyanobacterium SM2_3_2]
MLAGENAISSCVEAKLQFSCLESNCAYLLIQQRNEHYSALGYTHRTKFMFNIRENTMEDILTALGGKIIKLYLYKTSMWMFDDESIGIYREPFVEGMSEILDEVAQSYGKTDSMTVEFGEYLDRWEYSLELIREERQGARYYSPELDMEGWLCPVIHQYFDEVPDKIYMRVVEK